ncbi:unnamed protein product [Oreochromis niloticus]|nr:unnamed protein product [Mustela putorius furo]
MRLFPGAPSKVIFLKVGQKRILQFRQSYKNFLGPEMSHKTIKLALVSALEDLSKDDFEKFCHQLLDRREAPRVKRNKVEGKNRLQIADVLVSHFTEEGALRVTVDLLKAIGCSDEAEALVTEAGGGN